MDKVYTVILEEDEEDGGYAVHVPGLPGCVSQGDTKEEALANILDAIKLYLETLRAEGLPVPKGDPEIIIEQVQVAV